MQNNQQNQWKKLWKEKGYYIVLTLCLVAAGVSGIFFLSGAVREKKAVQESLAVPVTVQEPSEDPEAAIRQEQAQEQQPSEPAAAQVQPPAPQPEAAVMPVSGIVLQDYAMDHLAYNKTTKDWRVHNGVDLAAPLGETVAAAKSGTVAAVYEDEFLGVTVVVDHADGYTTRYCNLAKEPAVEAGQAVAAGDPLGKVGDTALLEIADQSHLHFEVTCHGDPVNPAAFLY